MKNIETLDKDLCDFGENVVIFQNCTKEEAIECLENRHCDDAEDYAYVVGRLEQLMDSLRDD